MEIVVQKYGGTSVANLDKLKIVANNIINTIKEGKKVVAVVSAQGKMTNNLIDELNEYKINNITSFEEQDKLLTVGEQITATKLSTLLQNMQISSKSLLGWQIPIITDNNFSDANILSVNKEKILKELETNDCLIVTGFCGVTKDYEITTLGRGGSDTTAVVIASTLNTKCYIYTDVDGIYTVDPNICKNIFKYEKISYDNMIKLAENGAKVLHTKCIEIAKENNTVIYSKKISENGISTGTKVTSIDEIKSGNILVPKIIGICLKETNKEENKEKEIIVSVITKEEDAELENYIDKKIKEIKFENPDYNDSVSKNVNKSSDGSYIYNLVFINNKNEVLEIAKETINSINNYNNK